MCAVGFELTAFIYYIIILIILINNYLQSLPISRHYLMKNYRKEVAKTQHIEVCG